MLKVEEELQILCQLNKPMFIFLNKLASVLLHTELFAHAEIRTSACQQPPCTQIVLSSAYPIRKLTLWGLHMGMEADTETQPFAWSYYPSCEVALN